MCFTLRRVASIDNLFLIGKHNPNIFKVNENVIIKYIRLQKIGFIEVTQIMLIVIA